MSKTDAQNIFNYIFQVGEPEVMGPYIFNNGTYKNGYLPITSYASRIFGGYGIAPSGEIVNGKFYEPNQGNDGSGIRTTLDMIGKMNRFNIYPNNATTMYRSLIGMYSSVKVLPTIWFDNTTPFEINCNGIYSDIINLQIGCFPSGGNPEYGMNCANIFNNCQKLFYLDQEVRSTVITSMEDAFANCQNLKILIGQWWCNNVINCQNMFNMTMMQMTGGYDDPWGYGGGYDYPMEYYWSDSSLKETSPMGMFFPNCTNCADMFAFCVSLTDVHWMTLNNTKDCSNMFNNCYSLKEVYRINIYNCLNCEDMFNNCVNLSNNALNNIANMLPSAGQLTNMYISNIGINANRFLPDALNVLSNKGYLDCIQYNTSNVSSYYNIEY